MCNYIYKEMFCEHFFYIVDSWCEEYIETQKRCEPIVIGKEYWGSQLCPACREKQQPNTHPCAKLIKHCQRRSSPPFRRFDATYYHEYHPSTGRVVTKVKVPPYDRDAQQQQQHHPYSAQHAASRRRRGSRTNYGSREYPLYLVSPHHDQRAFDRMP